MGGWSAMAGTHRFVVPDDAHAREPAEALASYGFAYVTALPSSRGTDWTVTVVDDGPYPPGHSERIEIVDLSLVGLSTESAVRTTGQTPE
jgi:hypothetical protein